MTSNEYNCSTAVGKGQGGKQFFLPTSERVEFSALLEYVY